MVIVHNSHTLIVRVKVFFFAPTKIFIFSLWLFRTEVQKLGGGIIGLDLFGVLCFAFQNWLGIVLVDWNVFNGNNKKILQIY